MIGPRLNPFIREHSVLGRMGSDSLMSMYITSSGYRALGESSDSQEASFNKESANMFILLYYL